MVRMICGVTAGGFLYAFFAAGARLPTWPSALACAGLLAAANLPGLASLGTFAFLLLILLGA